MHIRESKNPVYSYAFQRTVAAALGSRPAAALMDTATLHLFQGDSFVPTPQTALADFTDAECDFTDYVATAYVPAVPANIGPDIPGATGTGEYAVTTDPIVTANTVTGWWIESGTVVVAFERFDDADRVNMATTGDRLILAVDLPCACDIGPLP